MSPALAREALEAMKRAEIQKLCKDYGVKANLKTEALIDLLLDASKPLPPRRNPPQAQQRPPSTRIPSLAGARPRQQSSSSVIIHGSEDEGELTFQCHHKATPHEQSTPQRTRKAKQTQYRLGVGRPVIAGGSGARAITKSVTVSRSPKRTRSSRSIKPSEATITEEPELDGSLEAPPYSNKNTEHTNSHSQLNTHLVTGPSSTPLETVIAEALAPVQQELDSHKAQLTDLKEKVSSLIESFEIKIRNLTSEIQDLCARAKSSPSLDTSVAAVQEHSVRIPEPPSTPKRVRTPYRPSFALPATENSGPSELSSDPSNLDILVPPDLPTIGDVEQPRQTGLLLPGFPHSTLGKRPRDSMTSSTSGVFELVQEGMEMERESHVGRPAHKRAKLHEPEATSGEAPSSSEPRQVEPSDSSESSRRHGGPSFSVFSGREEDPPPPIERLPNFYGPTSPPLISAPATSSANNVENQNPFSFSFVPIASTPAQVGYPLTMGTFPHPEPPTSPSPAANPDRPGSRHSDRFGPYGVPRSSSRASGRGGSLARGEASGPSGLQRAPSSNEVASGIGLTVIKTSATEQGTPAPPAKRTMYGTELGDDTRFGDFGVDGVASGFWAGGRF
ncbi:hypothetical protein L210DRAFT_3642335 [Boletus edulis BED1]|uniref:Uncharacterized protein n=1 Tax=Boletus edulis BED1 TaxID=1328754 RepID=A0AAD4GIG0_BOLED|nr:hypothetical protein L210DRAFT_3642335 [Boletus edulis BED1]